MNEFLITANTYIVVNFTSEAMDYYYSVRRKQVASKDNNNIILVKHEESQTKDSTGGID